jgi:signal transduction histidine kinase/CheY-like chemotaxis protein
MPGISPNFSDMEFLGLLDKLSAAAYTCDAQGLITSFNSRAVDLWGRTPRLNDAKDAFCGSYKLFSTDGLPIRHDQCWMARALFENKEFNSREIVIERPDGARVTALAHANPIRDKTSTLIGAVNVLIDISDRKPVGDGLRESVHPEEKSLAVLAHELRNSLAPIRDSAAYLRSTPEWEASHIKRATNIISAQVNQLTYLIGDLLNSEGTSQGISKVQKVPIDLGATISKTVEVWRPILEARGHKLMLSFPSEPIIVHADAARIAQIVTNLLDNANQHTEPAGCISVEFRRTEVNAFLDVHNSGAGIPSDFLPHIFEPFARANGFQCYHKDSLGLGLSITKALVEAHDGEISVTSSGRGSSFTVRLPVIGAGQYYTGLLTDHKIASPCVLVVDDNAAFADSFSMLLESMGQNVAVVPDGAYAINAVQNISPRVVFIDIDLPGKDGYEVARKVRQAHSAKQMLLVAVTGHGKPDHARLRDAGFDYHLTKPVNIDELETILSQPELPAGDDT